MTNPDEDELKGIVGLESNPNWHRVLSWIAKSNQAAHEDLRSKSIFDAGRCAELWDMMSKIESAREVLREIEASRR